MDSKKLAKIISIVVEKEVKKQLPALIKEGVQKELKKLNVERVQPKPTIMEETDPFDLAISKLNEDRELVHEEPVQQKQKHFTSNPVLNEILNQTKPFSRDQRSPVQNKSVLDSLPKEPVNEHFSEMDKTLSMDSNMAAGGMEAMRTSMAAKMGYGDMVQNKPTNGGLGVKTGLPGLDKILNRDNSELVKKFKTRK